MRTLRLVSVASAVLLVGGLIGYAQAQPSFSIVNGGGQINVEADPDNPNGPGTGDTIAFTVRSEANTVGQVQYVDREGGTGQGQTVRHGQPSCLRVEDNMANFEVTWPDGTTSNVFVEDNPGNDMDTVTIVAGDPDGCGDDEPDMRTTLAEGSVEVQDNE